MLELVEDAPDTVVPVDAKAGGPTRLAISAVERLTELARMHERAALRDWMTGYRDVLRS